MNTIIFSIVIFISIVIMGAMMSSVISNIWNHNEDNLEKDRDRVKS